MLGKCISGIRISKILLGEDPDPRMGFATSVIAGSDSTRHGLPPKPKIVATPLGLHVFFTITAKPTPKSATRTQEHVTHKAPTQNAYREFI